MSVEKSIEVRLGVARGHWTLGEHDEALESLAKAVRDAPDAPEVAALIDAFRQQAASLPEGDAWVARISGLAGEVARARELEVDDSDRGTPPVATSTVAELLERQGHRDRALEVATDVLRRRPDDRRAQAVRDRLGGGARTEADPERALQIRALEGWLDAIVRRRGGAEA